MAIGTGKKIVLVVIVVLGYLIGNHANDDKRYEELKAKNHRHLVKMISRLLKLLMMRG
ncbi:hypothetical protein IE996_04420 [Klebsiella pneumoniae]|uniref:Uncharacterized protein n=1 Tax=Klebsiella pneumoniae TaxID=573 RepID=A0A927DCL2_KLEPN|nr:hypothetical protein [Klebsiella pneumoniae]MBD3701145.1 hypothetical protein [Klebsiella pneumoniae]MBD3701747.1 hypothetical protein [Klebsiella pneumoniae]MBD3704573.1 hypothetical protein [Klebsiella pneumoniae]MBD3708351.1 hypothetical protein [Klebsiella pneumoniae]